MESQEIAERARYRQFTEQLKRDAAALVVDLNDNSKEAVESRQRRSRLMARIEERTIAENLFLRAIEESQSMENLTPEQLTAVRKRIEIGLENRDKLPIDRPCSACGDGDTGMEHHQHYPPFRDSQAPENKGEQLGTCDRWGTTLHPKHHAKRADCLNWREESQGQQEPPRCINPQHGTEHLSACVFERSGAAQEVSPPKPGDELTCPQCDKPVFTDSKEVSPPALPKFSEQLAQLGKERQASGGDTRELREVLRRHWPFEVICSHEKKTDLVICSCSQWNSGDQVNVGEAIDRWIDHVFSESERVLAQGETR